MTAFAEVDPIPRLDDPAGLFTEAELTGLGDGLSVSGYDAPEGFDPLGGYPDAIPAGSTAHAISYAGTLQITDPVSGRTGLTYCIDLNTDTEIGVHYVIGDWSEANVPNLGYVGYILRRYFPTTDEPSQASNDDTRAAAVQAAIWFFSDNLILATNSPVRSYAEAIVADALANGPDTEPEEPELTVTPEQMAAPATGEIVGPFTVTADGPATIRSQGVEVFTDPNGNNRLGDGDVVQPSARLWARSISDEDPQGFVLERVVTVLVGTVLLYDGTNPSLQEAQKLVLAQQTQLVARAGATLEPFAAGSLEIVKTITGEAAGRQGRIAIVVDCQAPDSSLNRRFTRVLPAGTAPGEHRRLITGIPAGSVCTITERSNGDNQTVDVTTVIDPPTVTVETYEAQQVSITDTYRWHETPRPPHETPKPPHETPKPPHETPKPPHKCDEASSGHHHGEQKPGTGDCVESPTASLREDDSFLMITRDGVYGS
ncbi:thioester domain-containing protein [Nonomuraea turkmeniaca]|uniref:thioester domain-containing protein n=1 Tax=Nonomuraea turkmeniaca TaxID=103838 RepID=UPI00147717AC|nr:thioester domain-containing protein [Nonomuraea turkmeniaca]